MRYRIKSQITEPSAINSKVQRQHFTASLTYDPQMQDSYESMPIVPSWIEHDDWVGTGGPFANSSIMTDEDISGYGIKNVDHTKRQLPAWPLLDYYDPKDRIRYYTRYGGSRRYTHGNQWLSSHHPWITLKTLAQQAGAYDLNSLDVSSVQIERMSDNIGKLPAMAIKRLEELHLTTTLYEARELPQLFKLFKARGNLVDSLDTILRMPQLLFRKAPGARKRIQLAIREGILSQQYGLNPTVKDVQNIVKEIRKARIKPRRRQFSVRVRNQKEKVNKFTFHPSGAFKWDSKLYPDFANGEVRQTMTQERVDGLRVTDNRPGFQTEAFDKFAKLIDQTVGLNPVGLAWEILPFSYMVDFVVSVDDVLDSLWLNSNPQFVCEYWSSTKTSIAQEFSLSLCKDLNGDDAAMVWTWERVPEPVERYSSRYTRWKREQPSPLDSVRLRGATPKNLFLTVLIALGLRAPR